MWVWWVCVCGMVSVVGTAWVRMTVRNVHTLQDYLDKEQRHWILQRIDAVQSPTFSHVGWWWLVGRWWLALVVEKSKWDDERRQRRRHAIQGK